MIKKYYSVAIVMISYNDELIIRDCLESIRKQEYPSGKVEILLVDGGSTDETIEIAKEYGANVIIRKDLKDKPHKRGEIATMTPKTDLIIFFSADNRFQEKDCMLKMIEPFYDTDVVASETLKYGYDKNDPILSRYFALIGGCDPIAIGLGKADRMPHDTNKCKFSGKSIELKDYFLVKFKNDVSKLPTLGANGFIIRRALLEKVGMENSLHTDTCIKLIKNGYDQFAFIKNRHIVHYINITIKKFVLRRINWIAKYSSDDIKRSYTVFHKKDLFKLLWVIVSYLTLLFPLIRSIRGFFKKHDIAWFLHPFICFIFVFSYSIFYIKRFFLKLKII